MNKQLAQKFLSAFTIVMMVLAVLPFSPASAAPVQAPQQTDIGPASVGALSAWTNFYHGTADSQSSSYTVPAGSNRLLVVAVASAMTAVGARTVTLTYGGVALTDVGGDMGLSAPRQHTELYYLNEAGIESALSTTLAFTVNLGTTRVNDVFVAVFSGVDPITPITNYQNYNSGTGTTTNPVFSPVLTVNAHDQAVEIISSDRTGSTTTRTISYATNWTMSTQQTYTTTDAVRNAVANRSIPTTNTTDASSTTFSNTSLGSMTGMSIKAYNGTTVGTATATATGTSTIHVSMPYTDDTNGNNTYTVDYCLTSAACPPGGLGWTNWVTGDAHVASPYTTTITGLTPGTAYDIQATYNDGDGVTGGNPQVIANVVTFSNITLAPVHFISSNANPLYARPGDTVTLTFTASSPIQTPTVTIAGNVVTASSTGGNGWTASYLMASGTNGLVPFNIAFNDLLGNPGTPVAATTDGSSVTFENPLAFTITLQTASDTGISHTDNITNAVSPVFDVAFGEPVTGFTTGLSNNGGTATGCLFAVGSPTGTTYPVTVSGCSDGTLMVELAAGSVSNYVGDSNLVTDSPTVTLDRVAPSFFNVAPVTGAFINNVTTSSKVNYSLTEALNSGSIVATRTGGTSDGTVHTCTLSTSAKTSGDHFALNLSNGSGCSNAQTALVNGAIYRFDFNGSDVAGNAATQVESTGVTYVTSGPAADITYSVAGPYKSGTVVTITATFNEPMAPSPLPQIAISAVAGGVAQPATDMLYVSSTVYTYAYLVGAGNGTATISLSAGTDLAGNPVTAAPNSGATFTVDNTGPTAAITYTPAGGVYKPGDSGTITATFNEAMALLPAPQIAISGVVTVGATDMTRSSATVYTYALTVPGDAIEGTATITLSVGTDVAGNPLTSTPTSGGTFVISTSAPTVVSTTPANAATGAAVNGAVTIVWSNSVNCSTVTTSTVTISLGGWTKTSCTNATAVFTPTGQAYGQTYTVTVGTGVTDAAGTPMTAPYPFSYTTTATLPTAAGTYLWAAPAGAGGVIAAVWGAGGKGGNTFDLTGASSGGGGGGGAYSSVTVPVTPGHVYTIIIGAGATGTSAGGDSSFADGSTVLALAKGGSSVSGTGTAAGASGGVAASGIGAAKFSGGNGASGVSFGGGGGSSAGTSATGINATGVSGAVAPAGGGNGGAGTAVSGNGVAGSVPGGGGGGSFESTFLGSGTGGNGANGKIAITVLDPTITSVLCTPDKVAYLGTTSCTATVSHSLGAPDITGTVSWSVNGLGNTGNITTSPCTLSGTGASATCSVSYEPTAVGNGSHLLQAIYSGDGNYASSSGSQAVTVKLTPVITFNAAPTPTYLGGDFTVSATSTNTDSNTFVFSWVSGPCTLVAGGEFSSSGPGACVVQADELETANFLAAAPVQQTVTIGKATAAITFDPAPLATYPGPYFTVNAATTNTDSSSLVYSAVSGPCAWVSGAQFSPSGTGDCVVRADGAETTNFLAAFQTLHVTISVGTLKHVRDDYDGDGKSDPVKFDPATGVVWWLSSKTGLWDGMWMGGDTFQYVSGSDFNGDGITDPAKFYPATGTVWWVNSGSNTLGGQWLGPDLFTYITGSDFDGDGKADPAKFYPATGTVWWVNSATNTLGGQWLGADSFQYISGSDFDGDGKADPAKFYPATGTVWWIRSSDHTMDGKWLGPDSFQYVSASDFDGDGKTDPAKFYPDSGNLWWVRSSDGAMDGAWLGPGPYTVIAGDDFNGDGKTDPAIYTASTHTLSWLNTGTGIWTNIDLGAGTYNVVNGQQ